MRRRSARASAAKAASRKDRERRRNRRGRSAVLTFPRGAALPYYVRREITMKSASWMIAAVLLVAPSVVGGQDPSTPRANAPLVDADHKRVQPEQADVGRSVTVLGDPSKAGMYIT